MMLGTHMLHDEVKTIRLGMNLWISDLNINVTHAIKCILNIGIYNYKFDYF